MISYSWGRWGVITGSITSNNPGRNLWISTCWWNTCCERLRHTPGNRGLGFTNSNPGRRYIVSSRHTIWFSVVTIIAKNRPFIIINDTLTVKQGECTDCRISPGVHTANISGEQGHCKINGANLSNFTWWRSAPHLGVCRSDLCPRPRPHPTSRLLAATPESDMMNYHPTYLVTRGIIPNIHRRTIWFQEVSNVMLICLVLSHFKKHQQSLGHKHTHSHVYIQCRSASAGNSRVIFNWWKIIISE